MFAMQTMMVYIIAMGNKTFERGVKIIHTVPVSVERWYDRNTRSWVIQLKDMDGNQVGGAIYVGSKQEAIRQEKEWKREITFEGVDNG